MEDPVKSRFYEQTLILGQYQKNLGQYAKEAAKIHHRQISEIKRKRKAAIIGRRPSINIFGRKIKIPKKIISIGLFTSKIMELDFVFIAVMAIIIGLFSFVIDYVSSRLNYCHIYLYMISSYSIALQYFVWIIFPTTCILFSVAFVYIVGPQAIGSGMPQLKTMLQGVKLKQFLSFRTLIAKTIGLTVALGSGLPLGREGPLVHISAIIVILQVKVLKIFDTNAFGEEDRLIDFLTIASTIGVAVSNASPIGGVVLSLEVMSIYFSVSNYWRGFVGAFFGVTFSRLMAIWSADEYTITTIYRTNFNVDYPYEPMELVMFGMLGVLCGIGGGLFLKVYKAIILFFRNHKKLSNFLTKYLYIYPLFVTIAFSSIVFILRFTGILADHSSLKTLIQELFSSKSWIERGYPDEQVLLLKQFRNKFILESPEMQIFLNLIVFIIIQFFMTIITGTLSVPAGTFLALFTLGGAFGRLIGEITATLFPKGMAISGLTSSKIVPGQYAVVGAAAFSASINHALANIIIFCELTGQIVLILPLSISVLCAIFVSQKLGPSIYDLAIKLANLPYIPHFFGTRLLYATLVKDIMLQEFAFITIHDTYQNIKDIVEKYPSVRGFPIVENEESMALLGTIDQSELQYMLHYQISKKHFIEEKKTINKDKVKEQPHKIISRFKVFKVDSPIDKDTESSQDELASTLDETINISQDESSQDTLHRKYSAQHPKTHQTFGGLSRKVSKAAVSGLKAITGYKYLQKKQQEKAQIKITEFKNWQKKQLNQTVDFSIAIVDSAPVSLVPNTALYRAHTVFLLLHPTYIYITESGRLVGIVGSKEIRDAIEGKTKIILPTDISEMEIDTLDDRRESMKEQSKHSLVHLSKKTSKQSDQLLHTESFHSSKLVPTESKTTLDIRSLKSFASEKGDVSPLEKLESIAEAKKEIFKKDKRRSITESSDSESFTWTENSFKKLNMNDDVEKSKSVGDLRLESYDTIAYENSKKDIDFIEEESETSIHLPIDSDSKHNKEEEKDIDKVKQELESKTENKKDHKNVEKKKLTEDKK